MERICSICGKAFEAPRGNCIYCSQECRKRGINKVNKLRKEKKQVTIKKPEGLSLVEIARLAKAAGMSYGNYVREHKL